MPHRPARTFAPPPSAARGCLAALAALGGLALAGLGAGGFVAGTYALAQAARPSRTVPPPAAAPLDLAGARRAWGEIRARYRATERLVPA